MIWLPSSGARSLTGMIALFAIWTPGLELCCRHYLSKFSERNSSANFSPDAVAAQPEPVRYREDHPRFCGSAAAACVPESGWQGSDRPPQVGGASSDR